MSSNPYAKRSQMAPAARAVRAYAAPVNRATGLIAAFDPAGQGQFDLDSPPVPFIDLGWVENFQRTALTKYEALRTGPGANITVQYRTQPEARLEFDLPSWGKLQLALSGGTQQMNVLAEIPTTMPEPSGGTPLPASPVHSGSSRLSLFSLPASSANYSVGDIVAVDLDYTGTTGYLGSGAPGTYLLAPVTTGSMIDFARRITFNVSRVSAVTSSALLLAEPLIAPPTTGMGVQKVVAFVDHQRSGLALFQEVGPGLFVVAPDSGGRSCFFYPRLQPAGQRAEDRQEFAAPLFSHMLHVSLHALPTADSNDGETVLCYRSYFPAANAAV